jgi:hypothetical protein
MIRRSDNDAATRILGIVGSAQVHHVARRAGMRRFRLVTGIWGLYFKGGWGSGTGWVDHQTALQTDGDERISLSILTFEDGSHTYGKETLRGLAFRPLRGLDSADDVP